MKDKFDSDINGGSRRYIAPIAKRRSSRFTRRKGRACVFSEEQIALVESHLGSNRWCPVADRLKFRLSLYAGLRVGEIAELQIADMLEKSGEISNVIRVPANVAKGHKAREIEMHPKIREALVAFIQEYPQSPFVAITVRKFKIRKQNASALGQQFRNLYLEVGLKGFSSHSGRRTFITKLARAVNGTAHTLRDVQHLAGHAYLETTEAYIDRSERLADLVETLK